MIPKRIFFYWNGDKMSWMRYMTLYSFRKFNPDWEMILYISDNKNKKNWKGPEEQDFNNYSGENYLDNINDLNIIIKNVDFPDDIKDKLENLSPVHESDLFRYYELYRNGGIYCDMDVLFFRSIENFYNELKDYDLLIHQDTKFITIGFLGSSVNNQYYKDIYDIAINNINISNYQSMGVDIIYNIFGGSRKNPLILDNIKKKYNNLKIYNLPSNLIYKFDWTKIGYNYSNSLNVSNFDKESIGYHWFGGSSISQKFNNILNENNYFRYKTTFSELCKNII